MRVEEPSVRAGRSAFVTVLAWIFVGLGAAGSMTSILQTMLFSVFFAGHGMPRVPATDPHTGLPIPEAFVFFANNLRLISLSILVVSASTLVIAIGLLRRRNWARFFFIGLMALGMVGGVAGLVLWFDFASSLKDIAKTQDPNFAETFGLAVKVGAVVNSLLAGAFVWLLGWIIKRLSTEGVRREFS